MQNDAENAFAERMQGTPYDFWAHIAKGVLAGRHTLKEEMEYYAHVDWEFVKRYIAEHKH